MCHSRSCIPQESAVKLLACSTPASSAKEFDQKCWLYIASHLRPYHPGLSITGGVISTHVVVKGTLKWMLLIKLDLSIIRTQLNLFEAFINRETPRFPTNLGSMLPMQAPPPPLVERNRRGWHTVPLLLLDLFFCRVDGAITNHFGCWFSEKDHLSTVTLLTQKAGDFIEGSTYLPATAPSDVWDWI